MSEVPSFGRNYEDMPIFTVDTATAFALNEYIEDYGVGLTHALHDMITIGAFVHETETAGGELEFTYPNGEGTYQVDDAVYDAIAPVRRVKASMSDALQLLLDSLSEEQGITKDDALALLIEKARNLRVKHKKGAQITVRLQDGSRREVRFLQVE